MRRLARSGCDAPTGKGALTADTVIVGSGIAGLSAAYELAAACQMVIVVDRGAIAGGMTSRTTAHLAPICDDAISSLIVLRGEEMAPAVQQSQEAAVDRIEAIVAELDIDCAFRRLDGFLFPAEGMKREDAKKQLDKEFEAAQWPALSPLEAAEAPVERKGRHGLVRRRGAS
jgi:glycine/D-amino acid oxidase-like deaminating enzyme